MKQKNQNVPKQTSELPLGSMLLQGQYEVLKHLATGGFGMTYLARDSLSRMVVVKECFPEGLCIRDGRLVLPAHDVNQGAYQKIVWNFVAEARRLAKLKHPNIVAVHQVFEENHTAYMAMDYVEGEELLDILETAPDRLTPELLQSCLRDALGAVAHLHEMGILHRDISPDNLLLGSDGHLTLIDFGAAREKSQQSLGASTFLLAVKDGYSPHEFYVENAPQDASSDLYSLAATFHHLITGQPPEDCWTRHESAAAGMGDPYVPLAGGDWPFDEDFLALIDCALSVEKVDRIQTAAEWIDMLDDFREEEEVVKLAPPPPLHTRTPPAHLARKTAPQTSLKTTLKASSRLPHPTLAPAEVDLRALSKLVEETNTDLCDKAAAPRKKTREQVENGRKAPERPKPLVDIYGNPVEDVDKWMQEQERVLQAKAAREDYASNVQEDSDGTPRRKPLILRLLTGTLNLTRNSATPV